MLSSMIKDITEHHWQQSFQFVLMRYVSRNVLSSAFCILLLSLALLPTILGSVTHLSLDTRRGLCFFKIQRHGIQDGYIFHVYANRRTRTLQLLLLYSVSTLEIVFSIPLVMLVNRPAVFRDACEHGHIPLNSN